MGGTLRGVHDEITARARRDYGLLPTRLRLVFFDKMALETFVVAKEPVTGRKYVNLERFCKCLMVWWLWRLLNERSSLGRPNVIFHPFRRHLSIKEISPFTYKKISERVVDDI